MGPSNNFEMLVPRKDETRGLRVNESINFPGAYPESTSRVPSLWDYWPILLRYKWMILAVVLVSLAMGTVIALSTTPIFEAVGRIVINREGADAAGLKSAEASADSDDDYMVSVDTQTHVLQSDAIAKLVISKLSLDSNPAFAGKGASAASPTGAPLSANVPEIEPHREAGLVAKFHRALQISSIPRTRLLEIRFSSPDPVLAAKVVNTVIDTYIEQNYKTHFEATTRTSNWLTQQLSELQMKVEQSQEKLVRYQKEHGILGIDEKENIITSRLDELNRQLTAAEGDRMQKESVYRLASSGDPDLLSNLDPSSPLMKLRSQEVDLHRQRAEASVKFQPTYPKVEELDSEIAAVQADIKIEVNRVAEKYKKDYQAALEREKLLRASLENQKNEENELNESSIEYSLLKRDVESNRQLYEGLLQKLKEAGVMTGLRSSNVRIVDPASPPTAPSTPNIPRNLMMSLLVGLAGGVSLAFILESRDNTVHSLEQAQMITALPSLAFIPLASSPGRSLLRTPRLSRTTAASATALQPKSQMAEAYRALRTSILLSRTGQSAKVLMVTSALPQEGKTTTSVNLAIVLAQHDARVLLIEADMRRASISQVFGLEQPDVGLSTVLGRNTPIEAAIQPIPGIPNLSLLPAGPVPVNPAVLLGSSRMKDLLVNLKSRFDYVIIDTPPALSVTDSVLLSSLADAGLLVVRSGVTSKAALRRVCDVLAHVDARMMGVVLNAADAVESDRYYYGDRYHSYYDDSTSVTTTH
ncbi:MAG: polysaccharide biosynthesis tyrosine autokinase [Candidatus Korobacteraceae bacterium]